MVTTMDVFDNRNYRLNKNMLSCFGQWSLQSPRERYFYQTTTFLLIGSLLVPETIKFVEYIGDINGMIECFPVLCLHFRSISTMINCTLNAKKLKMLTNQIKESWTSRTADFELVILEQYAERGRLLTVLYAGYSASGLLMYLSGSLVPIFLDVLLPLNESRERIYPYEMKYFAGDDKNFFFILVHAWIAMPFALGIIVAYDTMLAVNVHHACSVFAVLGARLESIGRRSNENELTNDENVSRNDDKIYDDIVNCIKIHKEAVELAELLESSSHFTYFFIVGVSMLATTLTGYMTVTNLDQPAEALRFGAFAIGEVVHMFYLCWQGHVLVEHSENIFVSAYNVDWCDISPRAKQLLLVIMLRSAKPCELTAGKIFILSMENFATALKTSMSYFTMLLQMQ